MQGDVMEDKRFREEEINQSLIFDLDREREPAAYEREKNRLIESIYLYKIEENPENEEFGLEIVETVGDCLKYYEKDRGLFLHYFNRSFAQRKNRERSKQSLQEKSSGMHFTRKEIDNSRAVHAFLSSHEDVTPAELVTMLSSFADQFDMNEEELAKAVQTYTASFAQSGDAEVSDEERFTLFDTIAEQGDFTDRFADHESIRRLIDVCERCFEEQREGSKEFLSIMLTSLFADWDADGEHTDYIRSKSFFLEGVYEQVCRTGSPPKNKDLSVALQKSEANLTQIWKRFQKKLREEL